MDVVKEHITRGVKVSVTTSFLSEESNPEADEYYYAYNIHIKNGSEHTIKLLNRHSDIVDSLTGTRTVEGEGVVGDQPTLSPGESYTYISFCPMRSTIGYMHGYYQFIRISDQQLFEVVIPRFDLVLPGAYN